MMFITTPSIVLEHLKNLSPILSGSKMNPLLEGFLFETNKNFLKISAYSEDLRAQTSINIDVVPSESSKSFEKGFVINGKKIIEILQSLPEQPITFILLPDESSIKIKTDQGEYKLSVFDGEQYPSISREDGYSGNFTIKSDVLRNGFEKTIFAASDDIELRPNLCGVYCHFTDNESIFVATDTHRLIEYIRTDSRPEVKTIFIIPKKNIVVIAKILTKFDDACEVKFTKNTVLIQIGEYTVISKLVSGDFPRYRDIFPKQSERKLTVDRNSLISAIKRVRVFSNMENHKVQFEMNGSLLKITSVNEEYNESGIEQLTCTYQGAQFVISFNAGLLAEQLQNINSDAVVFEMTEQNKAVLIKPSQDNSGEQVTSLIMPIVGF